MHAYPIYVSLAHCRVLVIGAGKVGLRKIASLIACNPAEILVLDVVPPSPAMRKLAADAPVCFRQLAPNDIPGPEHIQGRTLVFAATSDRAMNAHIAAVCREAGVLCNIADAPDESSFIVPAHVRSGSLSVAVSTGGQSPALAKQIRKDLEQWLDSRYSGLITVMGRLRPQVLALGGCADSNGELFRSLAQSALGSLLAEGHMTKAAALLRDLLPERLHHCIEDVLHEPF